MHSLILFMVFVSGCLAHYRGAYETRNLIEPEHHGVAGPLEASSMPRCVANWIDKRVLVECPVCEDMDSLLPNHEKCNIVKGGKHYKKCERGAYVNEVCGNRLDCYRGPGEPCSEKMRYDVYGQKCARGFYCNDVFHICTGLGFAIDSNEQWYLNNVYRYPLPFPRDDQIPTKAESAVILA